MQIRRSLIILIYIPKILYKVLLGYKGHMVIFKILERSRLLIPSLLITDKSNSLDNIALKDFKFMKGFNMNAEHSI